MTFHIFRTTDTHVYGKNVDHFIVNVFPEDTNKASINLQLTNFSITYQPGTVVIFANMTEEERANNRYTATFWTFPINKYRITVRPVMKL